MRTKIKPVDCGSSMCECAPSLKGQRTNGPCRCFEGAPTETKQRLKRALRYWKREVLVLKDAQIPPGSLNELELAFWHMDLRDFATNAELSRIENALSARGVNTVKELLSMSERDLLSLRNIGPHAVAILKLVQRKLRQ